MNKNQTKSDRRFCAEKSEAVGWSGELRAARGLSREGEVCQWHKSLARAIYELCFCEHVSLRCRVYCVNQPRYILTKCRCEKRAPEGMDRHPLAIIVVVLCCFLRSSQ